MKLKADLFGVRAGDIYPTITPAGEDCPDELLDAARVLDALEDAPAPEVQGKAKGAAPENKSEG